MDSALPGNRTQTLIRDGSSLKLRSPKIGIEVLSGPGERTVTELPGPEVRVGSDKSCDLVLVDPTVSRHHATLVVDEIGLRVVDSGSTNATILDGTRILSAYAKPGSVVDFGGTRIRLRLTTSLVEVPLSSKTQFGALLGQSVAMRRLFSVLERVAPTDTTVLIEGETGAGKELVAEALHDESKRAEGPFVIFDCSAIASSLIESELFGHVRGAFTGATSDRAGAFENADGGSLFLDEIGELPVDLQPKLLRVLEQREVKRVGDAKPRRANVRIIAATNRSLSADVEAGRFREDLYYRLAVVRVTVPPLRQRMDDVPLLVAHFHKQLVDRGQTTRQVTQGLLNSFEAQAWPGNVRELRNAVEMAMSLGEESQSVASGAHETQRSFPIEMKVSLKSAIENFERAYVTEALKVTGGNISKAAEMAGSSRKYIYHAIKRFNLR